MVERSKASIAKHLPSYLCKCMCIASAANSRWLAWVRPNPGSGRPSCGYIARPSIRASHVLLINFQTISTEWRYHNFDQNRYWDFFPIPNFLKLKPRLFSEIKFSETETFYETKSFETETETCFPRPNSPKPKVWNPQKLIKVSKTEKFRNRNVDLWPSVQNILTISRGVFDDECIQFAVEWPYIQMNAKLIDFTPSHLQLLPKLNLPDW